LAEADRDALKPALERIASGKVHYPPHYEASRDYMIRQANEALALLADTEEAG